MRAFNFSATKLTSNAPSYENAAYAGGLSHTGNSFRPIGAPVKVVTGRLAQALQPSSYPAPVANPVKVVAPGRVQSYQGFAAPVANPVLHTPSIRGILGS